MKNIKKPKLDVKAFALGLAIVSGIIYIACAVLSWISPNFIAIIGNYLTHSIDLTQIIRTSITLSEIIFGLVLAIVFAYIIGALFAWTYNKLIK